MSGLFEGQFGQDMKAQAKRGVALFATAATGGIVALLVGFIVGFNVSVAAGIISGLVVALIVAVVFIVLVKKLVVGQVKAMDTLMKSPNSFGN
jgi:uncharacterized protein YacL